MGKYLDKWRDHPAKVSNCTTLNEAYTKMRKEAAKEQAWQRRTFKGKHREQAWTFLPPIIKIHGLLYYFVGVRSDRQIREFMADNWRDCGFNVRIQGDYIYARRKMVK